MKSLTSKVSIDTEKLFHKVERISPTEEEVFRRLIPKFRALRIDMDEFDGVYSKEAIERDRRSVEMKKNFFENDDSPLKKRAQILEALLAEQIELSEWFGENTMTIIPTEYDDFYHGIDLAAEFKENDNLQYLAMGLDVTTSQGISLLTKLMLIKGKIEAGELTKMKYFMSERLPDFRGQMVNIPSIIIGVDPRTINELAELWLTIDKSKNAGHDIDQITRDELREKAREAQHELAHHRTRVLILREIKLQLEAFINLANRKGHPEIIPSFEKLLVFIREALNKKSISRADEIANDSDDVFRAIKKNLEEYF